MSATNIFNKSLWTSSLILTDYILNQTMSLDVVTYPD